MTFNPGLVVLAVLIVGGMIYIGYRIRAAAQLRHELKVVEAEERQRGPLPPAPMADPAAMAAQLLSHHTDKNAASHRRMLIILCIFAVLITAASYIAVQWASHHY